MFVRQTTAPVGATGVSQHKRLTAGAAATLASLTSGGVPTMTRRGTTESVTATVVTLQVERGQANIVYYTLDGSAPSATNGLEVPVAPGYVTLAYPDQLKNTGAAALTNAQIQLFAGGATTVQAFYEFW